MPPVPLACHDRPVSTSVPGSGRTAADLSGNGAGPSGDGADRSWFRPDPAWAPPHPDTAAPHRTGFDPLTGAPVSGAHLQPTASSPPYAPPPPRRPATAPGRTDTGQPDWPMTPDGVPKMVRPAQGRMLGGVAAGAAQHLGIKVNWVRAAFAVLGAFAGAGVLAYALLWIFVPQARGNAAGVRSTSTNERRQAIGIAAIGVALAIVGTALGVGDWIGWVLGPLGLAAVGAAFIWREADERRRERWRRTAAGWVAPARGTLWRLIGGAVLVIGGLVIFAVGQLDFSAIRSALIAVILTLIGVGIITVPWWVRLVRDLGDERNGRIQEKERAEIAAHLHDSVLQTLALIQRQSADPREVQRLARSQERELRNWLYGPAGYTTAVGMPATATTTLSAALAAAAGEVEDTYAVKVSTVMVGDAPMDPEVAALAAASREAMVNAAKHSGEQEISLYAEVEGRRIEVFVRDRGAGFDPAAVAGDRHGLADSIRGRMARHGGAATVRSAPGQGTEVVLAITMKSADADGAVNLIKTTKAEDVQ